MKEIIKSEVNLSDEIYELFLNSSIRKKVKKNQILFNPNRATNKILFVETGILRGYRIIDGKEFTHHFYFSDWFATDFESFLKGNPSQIYIETLTNTIFYEFNKKDFIDLYKKHHQLEKLGRIIAEKAYLSTVEKLLDMQIFSLKQRYNSLIKKNPDLFQKVPQKHIASYLGVSEQSLSRIKNNLIS